MNPPQRNAAIAVAAGLAAAVALLAFATRPGGSDRGPPPGRCEVGATRALTPDAASRVVGLSRRGDELWALSVQRVGSARVARLLRSTSGREAPRTVANDTLPEGAELEGPFVSEGRVSFVATLGSAARTTSFDGRGARTTEGPAAASPARDAGAAPPAPRGLPPTARAATVLPRDGGWVAFWLDVGATPGPTLVAGRLDALGAPAGAPQVLGEFLHFDPTLLSSSLVAAATGPGEFAVAVPTPHGVRLAEVRCAR